MELKSYKIMEMYRALDKIGKEDVNLKTAVKIARNSEALETPAKLIEERQQELMKQYAKKDDKGNIIQGENGSVTIENASEYFTKLQDILDTDIEVELKKFKMDDLDGIKLSAKDILAIDPILEDEEESATDDDK